jgi:hypothetical protein
MHSMRNGVVETYATVPRDVAAVLMSIVGADADKRPLIPNVRDGRGLVIVYHQCRNLGGAKNLRRHCSCEGRRQCCGFVR